MSGSDALRAARRRAALAALLAATALLRATGAAAAPAPAAPGRAAFELELVVSAGSIPVHRSWWRTAWAWIAGASRSDAGAEPALVRPFDVAWEGPDRLVVVDPDARRVARFDAKGDHLGDVTCPDRAWAAPMSVAVDGGGAILVADAGAGVVIRWTARGCAVLGQGALERPTGVAVSGDRVVVVDPPVHQVVALSAAGAVVGRFGERGEGPGAFLYPTDVAAGPDGSLRVVDSLNFRIVHVSADGRWLGAFGAPGEEEWSLARPKGVSVDPAGRVYVSDAERDRVLVFRGDGSFLFSVGAPGTAPGQFAHPAGVAAAGARLAVADSLGARAQVFRSVGGGR